MAANLIGSEIIKLAGEIAEKINQGEPITNLTIGDFDPEIFPIPASLKEGIISAYNNNMTNYPPANGILALRKSLVKFVERKEKLSYDAEDIQIACGSRPLIYSTYQVLLDTNEKVLYPVPSWNNNHYCHLSHAQKIEIQTTPENNFMPTAEEIAPHLKDITLLALCSPLNPTGTVFSKEQLEGICKLVLDENLLREKEGKKPVYIMYDQIYSLLTMESVQHISPVQLFPELKNYTIYIDGLSKAFAATGVRVGWCYGPKEVMQKMKSILGHIGAWAPKAEQVAVANFLNDNSHVDEFLQDINDKIAIRLSKLYNGFTQLKGKGYAVKVIEPEAAIYLTVNFDLIGKKTADGKTLENTADITKYLLEEAKIGLVPFYSFGTKKESTWYRISVGTVSENAIDKMFDRLEEGLSKLN